LSAAPFTPDRLHFEKAYQVRHHFSLSAPLNALDFTEDLPGNSQHARIDLAGALHFNPSDGALTLENTGTTRAESYLTLGRLYHYAAIDLDVAAQHSAGYTANAILSLHCDAQNRVVVVQRDADAATKTFSVEVFKNGESVLNQTLSAAGIAAPYTLRLHVTGRYLSFFRVKDGVATYATTIDVGQWFDLRDDAVIKDFAVALGARLDPSESVTFTRLAQYLSSGTGQADPRVVHYEDGTPMVVDNRIWIAMTTRGYDPIPSSHQGMYCYNLTTHEWTLTGDLSFDRGDGLKRPWHATDVFFDRRDNQWKCLTTSHGDDHRIYYGVCDRDPRFGVAEISVDLLNCGINQGEDPSIIYDGEAGKWRLALCQDVGGGFNTLLLEATEWNGAYTPVAVNAATSSTGVLLQKVDGQYYVFQGRGTSNYEILSYPGLTTLGTLNVSPLLPDRNIWPVVIPVATPTETAYYFLTFDREQVTGAYSYGNLHWYRAAETTPPLNTPPDAPDGLRVNLLKNACSIGINVSPAFSWEVRDADNDERQSAYRIVFAKRRSDATAGNYFLDTGWMASSRSTGVVVDDLPSQLSPNSLYYWQVQTRDKAGAESPLSAPQPFTTAVDWPNTNGIWLEPASEAEKTNFLFLRHLFEITDRSRIEKAVVAATALNTESAKQFVFDLALNGQSVGVGPARNQNNTPQGNLLYYNSYDVTGCLQNGANVIAARAYNKDAARAFLLQMTVYYTDGTQQLLLHSARDAAAWKAKDGTLAFGQTDEMAAPANWYRLHRENIDATQYPFGFDAPPFVEDETWRPVRTTGNIAANRVLVPYPSGNVERFALPAANVVRLANGNYVVTLEKEIVGNLQLDLDSPTQQTVEIRLGEDLNADGSVRSDGRGHPNYVEHWTLKAGKQSLRSLNMKNFRYVEIVGSPVEITADNVSGSALRQAFDDNAAAFASSNPFLNELYAFTRYTIQATNQDVWTDSQARERGPYEGDAIINMAAANAFSADYSLGRHSHEYLINNQTWPEEYKLFSVEMAWTDYLYTGNRQSLDKYYAKLKNKFPGAFNADRRLVATAYSGSSDRVLIDWPEGERDNYRLQAYTTGYNAVYAGACRAMAHIAETLGNETDRLFYQRRADAIQAALIDQLYHPEKGAFDDSMSEDGVLSGHYSQHATAYALACGIYDSPEMAGRMAGYLQSQGGFKTSIYAAFFVLRGLFNAGADSLAMQWMTDEDENKPRTWAHVIRRLNATIAPEAWDPANKSNMTFSHPWGAAPAPAIAQGLFGIRPIAPAFERFQIKFQPGNVQRAEIKIPTLRGAIHAAYNLNSGENGLTAEVVIPANTSAEVSLPVAGIALSKIVVDGKPRIAERRGRFLTVTVGSGSHTLALSDEEQPYIELTARLNDDGVLRLGRTGQIALAAVNEQHEAIDLSAAAIAYAADDESVATVDSSGLVSAVGAGQTTIRIAVRLGAFEAVASLPLRVSDRPFPGDDKIQTVELRLLGSLTVGSTVVPATVGVLGDGSEIVFNNVDYASDNDAVAHVNADGSVTLRAAGSFTLRSTTAEHFEQLDPAFDFDRFEITPLYATRFDDGLNPFATGTTNNIAVQDKRLFVGKSSNAIYPNGADWNDYILTATVNPVPGTGTTVSPGGPAATFHFRANAARTQLYMWQFFCGNYLKKHVNITADGAVLTAVDGMNPAGQDSRIAIAAEGNRIMTYINGRLVDVASYTHYSRGTIGVRTGSNEEFYVDSLLVGTRKLLTTLTAVAVTSNAISVTDAGFPGNLNVYSSQGGLVTVNTFAPAPVSIYDVAGTCCVSNMNVNGTKSISLPPGFYIVTSGVEAVKILNK
jgi:hypothetical protein